MIKVRQIGMLDTEVINPVLTSNSAVANYTFLTDGGETYLIANTVNGDDSYVEGITFAAGEYLNGHNLRPWIGQELEIDESHIAYGNGEDYSDLAANVILTINNDGKLAITAQAPQSGYYFVIKGKMRLTEKAVIATIKSA